MSHPTTQFRSNNRLDFHTAAPEGWRGNPFDGKEFLYEKEPFKPNWTAVLKMIFSPNPQRKEKKNDEWKPPVSPGVDYLNDQSANWVVWLGHACYLLQINGVRYLTDPQLTDMPFVPRRVHPPFSYNEIRGVDYLLLSHDHRDHTDEQCVRAIVANNPIRKILCPLNLSRTIGAWVGDTTIEEAAWYQTYHLPEQDMVITFLPSQHWCRCGLLDFNRSLWGSFLFEFPDIETETSINRKIYFGGDSAATEYWAEIGKRFPGIDLCMLGVGAYSPSFMMKDVHANPEEAFRGYRDLGAHYWWPMHHGTYDLSNEPAGEPMRRSREAMLNAGLQDRLVPAVINQPWWFEKV